MKTPIEQKNVQQLYDYIVRLRMKVHNSMTGQNNIRINEQLESIATHLGVALDSITKETGLTETRRK